MQFFNKTHCSPFSLSDWGERITSAFPESGHGERKWDNLRCGHFKAPLPAMKGSCNFWKTTARRWSSLACRLSDGVRALARARTSSPLSDYSWKFKKRICMGTGRKEGSSSLVRWVICRASHKTVTALLPSILVRSTEMCHEITELEK